MPDSSPSCQARRIAAAVGSSTAYMVQLGRRHEAGASSSHISTTSGPMTAVLSIRVSPAG
jgi:hypothetical protein